MTAATSWPRRDLPITQRPIQLDEWEELDDVFAAFTADHGHAKDTR